MRMNELTDIIEPALRSAGLVVYRNKPEMTLKEVVKHSNSLKPDVHFAIHSNAFNTKVRGLEVFCHRFGGEGERLARIIYNKLEPLTPTKDRGVKEGANFYGEGKHLYELSNTIAPAALVEIAFHDNPEDAKWIINNMGIIADAIVQGIFVYFGIDNIILEYKRIIQENCKFHNPQGVWNITDKHPYAQALYMQWAASYTNKTP